MTTPTPEPVPAALFTRRRAFVYGLVVAGFLMWFTGAIPRWGQWYGDQPFYRAQVAAFFEGRLALTHHVEGVTHDLAWVDGGVQHVWGLGVPIYLAAWEVLGKILHVSPFPDRIAMMVGAALVIGALLRAWMGPAGGDQSAGSRGAFLITALLPGVVIMLRGRIAVYEEAEAYAYGTAMLLLAGVIAMMRRPSTWRYVLLCTLAGFSGLVRPTVWFYGVPAAVISTVLYVRARGGLARAARPVLVATALFLAGGATLYGTNYLRFGAGGEFGHRLNLEDLPGNIYATRFDYPYARAPLAVAAKEIAGAMFDRPELRAREGYHFYDQGLAVGQAPIPRWREYYFTDYTWPYAAIALAAIGLIAWAWMRRRRRDGLWRETRWLGVWALGGTLPLLAFYLYSPSVSSRYFLDIGPGMAVLVAIAWRHLAAWLDTRKLGTIGLAGFAFWWGFTVLNGRERRPWLSPLRVQAAIQTTLERTHPEAVLEDLPAAYDLDDPSLRAYIGADQWECPCYLDVYDEQACDHETSAIVAPPDVVEVHGWERKDAPLRVHVAGTGSACVAGQGRDGCDADDPDAPVPDGVDDPPSRFEQSWRGEPLYLNGTNWDLTTGAIAPATYLFVDAPRDVVVEVARDDGDAGAVWAPAVRAKVELEELPMLATESTARGVRFHFAAPKTARYREGLQVLFLAFGPPEHLDEATSGYKLLHVGWR